MSNYEKIESKLRAAQRKIIFITVLSNLFSALAVSAFLLMVFALLNSFFWFSPAARQTMFFIWLGVTISAAGWSVLKPIFSPPSLRSIAIEFERQYPALREHLIAAWDLMHQQPSNYGYSQKIIEAVVKRALSKFSKLSEKPVLPLGVLRSRALLLAFFVILFFGLAIAIPQSFSLGLLKVTMPNASFPKHTETTLVVTFPKGKAVRFEDFTIKIRAEGKIPDKVFVYRKLGKQSWSPFEAKRERGSNKVFVYTFRQLSEDVEFYVRGGDYTSPVFKIKVYDLPRVVDVSLVYDYPAYTGLATERVERNDGNIDAIYGTKVTIEAKASKNLSSAVLEINDSIRIPMRVDGRMAFGTMTIKQPGHYKILVWDEDGQEDPQPIKYRISVREDEKPVVQILYPAKDVDINEEMVLPLEVYGGDDFGFSKFLIKFRIRNRDTTLRSVRIPFKQFGKKEVRVSYVWHLSGLGLVPDDVVEYWVEGYDNDFLRGPKMARSRKFAVRFPSIDEIMAKAMSEYDEQTQSVEDVSRKQKELMKQAEEMARKLSIAKDKLTYEQREQARKLLAQQQKLARQLEQTAKQLRETIERIERDRLVAQQIVEKMWEMQKLLEEILPQELKDAMRKLQEALEKLDPKLLEQAMKQLNITQEQLLQKLDRSLELLRRIRAEMKLDELRKLAESIKKLEDETKAGLRAGEDKDKLARMQQKAKEQLQKLEDEAEKLAEEMKQMSDMPADEMEKLSSELSQMQLPKMAQDAYDKISQGNRTGAMKMCANISSRLSKLSQRLSQIQSSMNQMLKQALNLDIKRTVQRLLYVSENLEEVINKLRDRSTPAQSQELARKIGEMRQNLKFVIEKVGEMGGKTFLIPPILYSVLVDADNALATATEKLSESRYLPYDRSPEIAYSKVNIAAEMLLRTKKSLNQAQSASGMQQLLQQLQRMCNKQGQINQQTIPLAAQCSKPGNLSPEAQAMAARLAAEQEALRKSLEKLRQEFEQHSNILGRMEKTIEDMKKVEEELRRLKVNQRTLERQDRILSRMLDAQRSIHKREFTRKRESRPGKDVVRKSPGPLPEDLGAKRNSAQQALLRILSKPYPREYQDAVRKYFKALSGLMAPKQE